MSHERQVELLIQIRGEIRSLNNRMFTLLLVLIAAVTGVNLI